MPNLAHDPADRRTAAHPPRRNSRWSDTPVLDRNRKPKAACLTERDIDGIFAPLTRYRYLPADYIHAFAGGSFDYLVNRLNLLSRQPNRYVSRPPQQRANAAANHRPLVYELADKGWTVMHERGVMQEHSRAPSNFAHELMTCQVLASFELGVRDTANRLIARSDILQSQSLPDATRHSPKPYLIPVTVTIDGAMIATHVAADGTPFGIGRSLGGDTAFFFCPGVEADRGTEPIDTSDFQRSSLFKKFVLYLTVEAQGSLIRDVYFSRKRRTGSIGVVGNPSLCPAFRVRRGSGREYGFAASRARRATRPTPERISVPWGHGADISRRR